MPDHRAAVMELKRAFGSALRRLRMERGLSQREMAMLNGLNQNVISAAECGKTNTSLMMMARLAQAVGGDVPAMLTKQE
jgi:transcriptional regulator with XRE-family HTH domain